MAAPLTPAQLRQLDDEACCPEAGGDRLGQSTWAWRRGPARAADPRMTRASGLRSLIVSARWTRTHPEPSSEALARFFRPHGTASRAPSGEPTGSLADSARTRRTGSTLSAARLAEEVRRACAWRAEKGSGCVAAPRAEGWGPRGSELQRTVRSRCLRRRRAGCPRSKRRSSARSRFSHGLDARALGSGVTPMVFVIPCHVVLRLPIGRNRTVFGHGISGRRLRGKRASRSAANLVSRPFSTRRLRGCSPKGLVGAESRRARRPSPVLLHQAHRTLVRPCVGVERRFRQSRPAPGVG